MTNATTALTTKEVAAKLGITPQHLRKVLRTMPDHDDSAYTRYSWEEGSAGLRNTIAAVKKAFKAETAKEAPTS